MALDASTILDSIDVIRNSLIIQHLNVSVASSATAIPNTSIPSTLTDGNGDKLSDYLGPAPLLLHSIAITYTSTFQGSYSLYVKQPGLNIDNNKFSLPAASTSGFDYVPTGKAFLIPANSTLNIYAYNSGSATTAGVFNLLAIYQKLDTLSADQQALL